MPDEKRPPLAKVVEHPAVRAERAEHRMHLLADAGDRLVAAIADCDVSKTPTLVRDRLYAAVLNYEDVRRRL